jgi:hypothetical protein
MDTWGVSGEIKRVTPHKHDIRARQRPSQHWRSKNSIVFDKRKDAIRDP